jgi:hypothetical protein
MRCICWRIETNSTLTAWPASAGGAVAASAPAHDRERAVDGHLQFLARHALDHRAKLGQLFLVAAGDFLDIARLDARHVGDRVEQVGERERVDLAAALVHFLADRGDGLIGHLIGDQHALAVEARGGDGAARFAGQLDTGRHDLLGLDHLSMASLRRLACI